MVRATPIETAIAQFGSEMKLAKAIGYSQTIVNKVRRGARISAEMAVAIEKATAGKVTRQQFRPDLFEEPQRVAS